MVWLLVQERSRLKLEEISEKSGADYRLVAVSIHKLRQQMKEDKKIGLAYEKIVAITDN